jgi:hypothetical protein
MTTENPQQTTAHALAQIGKQATTETPVTPGPDGWLDALAELDGVACKFKMQDSLSWSFVWHEDGAYHASNLVPGLEDRENGELSRHEAGALLDGGLRYRPVDRQEVGGAEPARLDDERDALLCRECRDNYPPPEGPV